VVQLDVISSRHDTIELLVAAPTTNDALRAVMAKVSKLISWVTRKGEQASFGPSSTLWQQ
jgi:hypothetical protein